MKRNRFINSLVALIVTAMLVIVSCDTDDMSAPTTVTLDENVISLVLGTSQRLIATISPPASTSDIVWSSSDTDVAIVSGGVVQSVGLGKAVINAKIGNSTSFCDVYVTDESVQVTNIFMNKTELDMRVGDVEHLEATIEPYQATNRRKRWTSSNSSVASVHEINGTLTAHALGQTVITVTTLDGGYTATLNVSVLPIIELYTPLESIIRLHPTDPDKKVGFTWNKIEGVTQYILKISTSSLFEDDDIVYSVTATDNKLDVPEYALNEASKGIPGNLVPLYWTVTSGTPGVKVLPATGRLNLTPDRREYLRLSTGSASGIQLQQLAGEYQYAITTNGSARVNSVALQNNYPADSSVVDLQYRSNRDLNALTLRFMSSAGTVLGTVEKQVAQSANWKTLRIIQGKLPEGWGKAGDYIQFDFGAASGYQIDVNAIHLSGMTLAEEKASYVPQILSVSYWNNHLAMITHQPNYFKFLVLNRDPNASTVPLSKDLPAGAVLLSFEYINDKDVASNFQAYLGPGLAESKSIRTGRIPQSSTWKEYTVDLTNLRANFGWGKAGDFIRLDFGEDPSIGMTMEIRNIHMKYK